MATTAVHGLADLHRALAKAERDVRLGVRKELRQVAEPVRADAEDLAGAEIRNIGPAWQRMRTGVTSKAVYVAPRQRSRASRVNPRARRPNLAPLLMGRAMEPALSRNQATVERELEQMLDQVADRFNRSPL